MAEKEAKKNMSKEQKKAEKEKVNQQEEMYVCYRPANWLFDKETGIRLACLMVVLRKLVLSR
jgi:hypothetical protein